MKYEEFKTILIEELKDFYGADATVELTTATKNNGINLEGIIIRIGGANVSPIIYLQQYYEEYMENENSSISEIAGEIIELRERHNLKDADEVIEQITNWSYVRDRIYPMVVSYEDNEERISQSQFVAKPFLDLAIMLYVRLDSLHCIGGEATVKVTKQMLDALGISKDEAFDKALDNMTSTDGYIIQDIFTAIMGMVDADVSIEESREKMFVLTNTNKSLGAAGILLLESDLMEDKLKDSYYILPSSIHEILLIPENNEMDVNMLKSMVEEVNMAEVTREEKLSDSVYYYNSSTRKVSKVA